MHVHTAAFTYQPRLHETHVHLGLLGDLVTSGCFVHRGYIVDAIRQLLSLHA